MKDNTMILKKILLNGNCYSVEVGDGGEEMCLGRNDAKRFREQRQW
jgi:hypothetical protein